MTPSPGKRVGGILDTNMVIFASQLPADLLPDAAAISTVTIAELSTGVSRAGHASEAAARLALLQAAESAFAPLPFDLQAARAYGRIFTAVVSVGRSPRARVADQMIAATALAHGLTLYTTNDADYRGLEGLVPVVAVRRPTP